jgi:glycerophosphoryl diester phosphodiesterase
MLDEQKHLRAPAGLAETAKYADGIGPALSDVITKKDGGGYEATSLVRDAHAAGLEVHPYTFRADALPPGMATLEDLLRLALVDIGVDGVFTDHTDRAVAFLRKR